MNTITTLNLNNGKNRKYFLSDRELSFAIKLCKSLDVTYIVAPVTDQQMIDEHVSQLTHLCKIVGKTHDASTVTAKEARAALRDDFDEFEAWLFESI
jgi:hypothetical protein